MSVVMTSCLIHNGIVYFCFLQLLDEPAPKPTILSLCPFLPQLCILIFFILLLLNYGFGTFFWLLPFLFQVGVMSCSTSTFAAFGGNPLVLQFVLFVQHIGSLWSSTKCGKTVFIFCYVNVLFFCFIFFISYMALLSLLSPLNTHLCFAALF